MFKDTDYEEILKFKNPIFVDLRSEGEFEEGTIPGAGGGGESCIADDL